MAQNIQVPIRNEDELMQLISSAIVRTVQVARVKLVVTEFHNVLVDGTRCTSAEMQMAAGHYRVRVDAGILKVRPGGATIRFEIMSNDGMVYYPLGISFKRTDNQSLPPGQRLGRESFPRAAIRVEEKLMYLVDSYPDSERQATYDFHLMIQRESDGAIGIIDPPIEHEPDSLN